MKLLSVPLIVIMISALFQPFANADTPKAPTPTEKAKTAKINDADLKILATLHHVNGMEIDLGKLALKQGTTAIKTYATMLVNDHASNDKDLTALAKKRATAIPMPMATTDAEKAEMKDMDELVKKLKLLKGADFDTAYLGMMVSGHEGVVMKIDAAIGLTTDDDVKTYLTMTKPAVQLHAQRAKELATVKPKS